MYCRQCGTELPEDARFCSSCGADQEKSAEGNGAAHMAEASRAAVQGLLKKAKKSSLFRETVGYGKAVLSADPTRPLAEAAKSNSLFWVVAFVVNVLLFAFAACGNLAQILNHGTGWFIHAAVTYLKEMVPGGSAALFGAEEQLAVNIPPLYSLFVPLLFAALLVFALELAGMYFPFRLAKQKPDSIRSFLNVLAVSTIPLTLTCLVNLLLGLFLPAATVCTLLAALAVHIMLLQEGVKQLGTVKLSPIWGIGLTGLVICAVLLLALGVVAESALRDVLDMFAKSGMDFVGNTLGDVYGGLLDILL